MGGRGRSSSGHAPRQEGTRSACVAPHLHSSRFFTNTLVNLTSLSLERSERRRKGPTNTGREQGGSTQKGT